jgi:hypothetical protein
VPAGILAAVEVGAPCACSVLALQPAIASNPTQTANTSCIKSFFAPRLHCEAPLFCKQFSIVKFT